MTSECKYIRHERCRLQETLYWHRSQFAIQHRLIVSLRTNSNFKYHFLHDCLIGVSIEILKFVQVVRRPTLTEFLPSPLVCVADGDVNVTLSGDGYGNCFFIIILCFCENSHIFSAYIEWSKWWSNCHFETDKNNRYLSLTSLKLSYLFFWQSKTTNKRSIDCVANAFVERLQWFANYATQTRCLQVRYRYRMFRLFDFICI